MTEQRHEGVLKCCRDILASKSCPLDVRKHVGLVQKPKKS